ncbi:hypothetical protein ACHAXN_007403 [Cyclotella atomus]|jgi:hypothetical protein
MKLSALIATAIATTLGVATAAPAIVWKKGASSSSPIHTSEPIHARSLLASVNGESSSALAAVVFVVGRDADGSEGLRKLASSGSLPSVHERYASADSIHHSVSGVESARTVARDARTDYNGKVVEVTLDEFNRKLSSMTQTTPESENKISKSEQKRRRDIAQADILIVSVSPSDSFIDTIITSAIDSPSIQNVVLSSVRSIDEVKHARKLAVNEKFTKVSPRRRLEDAANVDANANANNQNMDGVYYVNMTPNIFAGLLFFFMFAFTAYLGLGCMNMIEGQDVYVKKMPHIGREV